MEIGERSIGDAAVRRLWFYSDYPDIVVELDPNQGGSGAHINIFLRLFRHEQKMRVWQSGDREARMFLRCQMK
jgi:hypothetical protein